MYPISERDYLWHKTWMDMAFIISQMSTCKGHKVGAVLVKDKKLISIGFNGSPSNTDHCIDVGCYQDENHHCIRTVHAEQNAIITAALHGLSTKDSTLYSTLEPCLDCSKIAINAGIKRIIFSEHHHLTPLKMQMLQQAEVKYHSFDDLANYLKKRLV